MASFLFLCEGSNVILDRQGADPYVGFIAEKPLKAKNVELAEKFARIELLKNWKLLFNQHNDAGTPVLTVLAARQSRNPFRTVKWREDFSFYRDNEQRDEIVDQLMQKHRFN